jgi:hypothetical protein
MKVKILDSSPLLGFARSQRVSQELTDDRGDRAPLFKGPSSQGSIGLLRRQIDPPDLDGIADKWVLNRSSF